MSNRFVQVKTCFNVLFLYIIQIFLSSLRYNFHLLYTYIATSIREKPFKACRYIFLCYVIISCLYDIVNAKYQNKKKIKKNIKSYCLSNTL